MTTETIVKERPILFSASMVRAILADAKTQTRRVITPQPTAQLYSVNGGPEWAYPDPRDPDVPDWDRIRLCPYGAVGDRLWVRETWSLIDDHEGMVCVGYVAGPGRDYAREWLTIGHTRVEGARKFYGKANIPSVHMPRWASRLTLEIISIRVERLQDISQTDALAEGTQGRHSFAALWDELNSKRGYPWSSSPWVWVLSFAPTRGREG